MVVVHIPGLPTSAAPQGAGRLLRSLRKSKKNENPKTCPLSLPLYIPRTFIPIKHSGTGDLIIIKATAAHILKTILLLLLLLKSETLILIDQKLTLQIKLVRLGTLRVKNVLRYALVHLKQRL